MNRNIEFRGKTKDNEWIYGYYHKEISTSLALQEYGIGEIDTHYIHTVLNHLPFKVEVIGETVGQYTGLKDKNGKKIFEGDIVHYYDFTSVYSREITGKVIYSQDCMFEIEYDDEIIKNHKTTRPLVCNEHPIFAEKKIEVIGNIYETDLESKGE